MAEAELISGVSIAPKYDGFNIVHVEYKQVNGTPIPASILIPNNLKPGKYPVAVRWHGGGFGTGKRLDPAWYGDWTLDLYLKHHAIAITPDYRLMPEATGLDILQDAKDFYAWLFTEGNLSKYLPSGVQPNLDGILVTGESAGGWHALQAGFLHPDRVSGIISHYPMIDMKAPHFAQAYEKQLFSPPRPQMDPAILEEYVSNLKGDEVVSSRQPPDGEKFVVIMMQQGLYPKYFGTERELYPLEMLERVEKFPKTWILHGRVDSAVPCAGTEKFEEVFRERFPEGLLYVSYHDGEDHGFDLHDAKEGKSATLETWWVKDGLVKAGLSNGW